MSKRSNTKMLYGCWILNLVALGSLLTGTITLPPTSILRISNGAKLDLGNPLSVSGAIQLGTGSTIEGNSIILTDGSSLSAIDNNSAEIQGPCQLNLSTDPLQNLQLGRIPINFLGPNVVALNTQISLQNTWTISGNVQLNGNGNLIDFSNANAMLVIAAGATLNCTDVIFKNANSSKLVFSDPTATLNLSGAEIGMDAIGSYTQGNWIVSSDSKLILAGNNLFFSQYATFGVSGGTLWIDNVGGAAVPSFGFVDAFATFSSYIDNLTVRLVVDQSKIISPGAANLISGFTGGTVDVAAPVNLSPSQVINVTNDTSIGGGGSSMTFSNSSHAQVVVPPATAVTFADVGLLRITQSTFQLDPTSVIQFKNDVVLEFVEDVVYDTGQLSIVGQGSQVILRGLGGHKKMTLTTNPVTGEAATFSLGTGTLVLEDFEINGMQHITSQTTSSSSGNYSGKIVLNGNARINLAFDTTLNYEISGNNNAFILHSNNLNLLGAIRYADFYDSELTLNFNLSNDAEELAVNVGKNCILLNAEEGNCGLLFGNDRVTLNLLSPTSLVAQGRSYIGGETIIIEGNPIFQETNTFSLLGNVNITSNHLPNPIELLSASSITLNNIENLGFYSTEESPFNTKSISVPRPNLVVKNSLLAGNLQGSIEVRPQGALLSFSPNLKSRLNLILAGNTRISTISRRQGLTAQIIRIDITEDNLNDTSLVDTIKPIDTLYVTGTNNVIKVTGIFQMSGALVMDEGSELIFSFDDSVDSPKGVIFNSPTGPFATNLPASASIVFDGSGTVIFANGSILTFAGHPQNQQQQISPGIFKDDRPSLIFQNYAKLDLSDNHNLLLKGLGKLVFYNNGEGNLTSGKLTLGNASSDFFDLVIDRNSTFNIGDGVSTIIDPAKLPARLSMPVGLYNLRVIHGSQLSINSGGVFEVSLLNSTFAGGYLASALFTDGSILKLTGQGALAFGQEDFTNASQLSSTFSWNNIAGNINGTGNIALITSDSTKPKIIAACNNQLINASSISPLDLTKTMVKATTTLTTVKDFFDRLDGVTKIITNNNTIISLAPGDTILSENVNSGTLSIRSASNSTYQISTNQ